MRPHVSFRRAMSSRDSSPCLSRALIAAALSAFVAACSVMGSPMNRASATPAASTLGATGATHAASLDVRTTLGLLRGQLSGATREFLGIPYAKPPIGALRFAPPAPVEPWVGTLDATQFGDACPQDDPVLSPQQMQSEDCLTLNVYSPAASTQPLPVMVFIHGGSFVSGGSSQYDAKALSDTRAVVVTLNYRLGALGFLSHPALDATRPDAPSGSDGLRDQQLAFRWVHDHIAAFGGNPNNVTVFGESAGAISACLHWVAPESRVLAQRFIIESGACTSDAYATQDKADANALGRGLSETLCPGMADVLSCLREKSAEEIIQWGAPRGQFGAGWRPTTEGPGGVLPDTVENLLASSSALSPIIIGTNAREWGLFQRLGAVTPTNREKLARILATTFGKRASEVASHYPAQTDEDAGEVYVRLVTDAAFRCPTRYLAQQASQRGASVFLYSFEQGSALHAQELDYVFGDNVMSYYYDAQPPSAALTASVQRYWTRFALRGDPNGKGDVDWPRYRIETDRHLVLVDPPRGGRGLVRGHCEFWREYFEHGGTIDLH
jgi:para-nitrobenzyl esterase